MGIIHIIPPGTKFDFLSKAPIFSKVSIVAFLLAVGVIFAVGVNPGLDFSGGHEILLAFEKPVGVKEVRSRLSDRFPTVDTSVQSFEVPTSTKTFHLVRIERPETFGEQEIAALNKAFKDQYGDKFKDLRYNADAGDVVEVEFTEGATKAADLSDAALSKAVASTKHEVRLVRPVGRPDRPRYAIVLRGIDVTVVADMQALDPAVEAARIEFVGPTVGKQLRDDGVLAVLYALLCILIYVAFRFDLFYSPGAIICLFHDAIITVAVLALIGEEFSLATIAGLLTLVGYSINDTIVVFDRIRETIGKTQGAPVKDVLNRAINETLGRTLMTSLSTFVACVCLMVFGKGTVLASFGLIMTVGIFIGTYSSIYVASPIFLFLRTRFGPRQIVSSKISEAGERARAGA